MTAQSVTRPRQRKSNRKPPANTIANHIVTLATTTPAKPVEIAESLNTSIQHVCQTLERYGIDHKATESFRKHRAEILAGLQSKILESVDLEDIKEASLLQRVTAAGILYDKERLETGKSTANLGVLIAQIESLQDEIRHEDI